MGSAGIFGKIFQAPLTPELANLPFKTLSYAQKCCNLMAELAVFLTFALVLEKAKE